MLEAERDSVDRATEHAMVVRPFGRPMDVPLVTNNWLKNFQKGKLVKGIPGDVYADGWHAVMEQVLPRATTIVACHPQSPDTCFGWICGELVGGGAYPEATLLLHYCYVKHDFKAKRAKGRGFEGGFGIGRMLLQTLVEVSEKTLGRPLEAVVASCITPQGHGWLDRMAEDEVIPVRHIYDPFLLFATLPEGWY